MGVKVYYSEISGQKEVKKRQQRVMMILDSKNIPYEAIDISDPSREADKDLMREKAKPKGDAKFVLAPQIFNEEEYLGDFDDFELANENDELESFLKTPKVENNNVKVTNGTSRGSSAEAEAKPTESVAAVDSGETNVTEEATPAPQEESSNPVSEEPPAAESEPTPADSSTAEPEEEEEADE